MVEDATSKICSENGNTNEALDNFIDNREGGNNEEKLSIWTYILIAIFVCVNFIVLSILGIIIIINENSEKFGQKSRSNESENAYVVNLDMFETSQQVSDLSPPYIITQQQSQPQSSVSSIDVKKNKYIRNAKNLKNSSLCLFCIKYTCSIFIIFYFYIFIFYYIMTFFLNLSGNKNEIS